MSVCLSVCLSVRHHESCHYAQRNVQPKVPTASAQSGKHCVFSVCSKREKANKLISRCFPRHSKAASYRGHCFCSLPYTFRSCSLTRALFRALRTRNSSLARPRPGQILAPRVCTSVLFIVFFICIGYLQSSCLRLAHTASLQSVIAYSSLRLGCHVDNVHAPPIWR